MKKMTVIILAAALAAALMAGCSGNSDDSSSKSDTTSTNSTVSTESTSNTSESEESKTESKEESKTESSKEEGTESKSEESKAETQKEVTAAVTYKDVTITIDAEFDPILKKLGAPDNKQTIEAEDEDSQDAYSYTYDNLTIYTNEKDGKQYVIDVSINSPGEAKTVNGIQIGSSKEDVAKIYGTVSDETAFTYESGDYVLIFTFQDDMVIDISLGRGLTDDDLE